MLAVQPPEEQNSTAPAGEEASPLEEAAVIIFSPPEYNYFELGPWEDIAGCWRDMTRIGLCCEAVGKDFRQDSLFSDCRC